ncbi:MAG: efflux RND transporter periplasmic adaptor subunit [Deltaproteobacteria bacterium]|nr:efflux RND transporter periplasmic adaptor subunit [Deltaproteobacteria bacterium]
MNRRIKILIPLVILAFGVAGAVVIRLIRPEIESAPPEVFAPHVRVTRVEPQNFEFVIRAHGTVTPRTESTVVPQVSGPVVWVSPIFASGGFFEENEPLVRIERADYEAALESARAVIARSESEYERALKDAKRQKRLANQSVASASRHDEAVNAEQIAKATLREAKAMRGRAERDLDRTEIRAPYTGRVREENVDVGQFVTRGTAIGKIYAVDYAEVRLPIPDSELSFVDLPMLYRGEADDGVGPEVELRARFAGRDHSWSGRIVRTEGEIDARSRMVNVVARVEDPYGHGPDAGERPPLAVGLFVEAEIRGRSIEGAVILPRSVLRTGDRVLVVDGNGRVEFRGVEVLRSERDSVVIGSGLEAGEEVIVSPLTTVVEGMAVRTVRDEEEPNEPHGALAEDAERTDPVAAAAR